MAGPGTRRRVRRAWSSGMVALALAVPLGPAAPAVADSSGGTGYVWGVGLAGQLGNGPQGSAVPIPLQDVAGIVFIDIDIGVGFDLALTDDGTIYGWGQNNVGQLGRGTTSPPARTPLPVASPEGVTFTTLAAGYVHGLALATDGTAYSWGQNSFGQLGDRTLSDRHAPGPVVMPEAVSFVGIAGGLDASVAVGSDGSVYTWGANHAGQLGDGTTEGREPIPAPAATPEGVRFTAVAAGAEYAMALADDGTVYTWGANGFGQLGRGTTGGVDPTPAPVVMPEGVRFVAVSAGRQFAMALADDGTVYTWGFNGFGQLGNGTTGGTNPTPAPIAMPSGTTFAAVDGGSHVGSALTPGGVLYIWGRNANRLFGDGTTTMTVRNVPGQTAPPAGVTFGAMAMTSGSMSNAGIAGLPPHAVSAHHGGGQEVHVHQPFPDPLQAVVTTLAGDPVRGVPVTFTIHSPATFDDGETSAVAFTGDGGVATSPPLIATGETGVVEVTATAAGIAQAATFSLTVVPEPDPGGEPPVDPPPPVDPGAPSPAPPADPGAPSPPAPPDPGAPSPPLSPDPGPPSPDALPDTGSGAAWLLRLAAALAAAGVLPFLLSRRPGTGCGRTSGRRVR